MCGAHRSITLRGRESELGSLRAVTSSVVDVWVEAEEDGALLVGWTLSAGDAEVEIAVGTSPEGIDRTHVLTAGAQQRSVRVDDPGPGRRYVSVAAPGGGRAVIGAPRRVPFEGVTNFRDLGGYRVAGGHTRWGVVFRSDALHRLTPADRVSYEQLGFRAVYDLRGEPERERGPDPFVSIPLAVSGRPVGEEPVAPDRSELKHTADGEAMLRELYGGILANSGPTLGRLLGSLADPTALPAAFHCTGGKDRTGVAAALLLELLGVARHDVLDDYELTARYRTRVHQGDSYESLLVLGMAPEAAAAVLGTPRWAMEETLEELDARYGGAEPYLLGPAGLEQGVLQRLRDTLVC